MGFWEIVYWVFVAISTIHSIAQTRKQKARMRAMQEEADKRADAAKGFQLVTEGEAAPLWTLYGRGKAGGIRVYHNTANTLVSVAPAVGGQMWGTLGTTTRTIPSGMLWVPGTVVTEPFGTTAGEKHEFLFVQQALGFSGMSNCVGIDIDDTPFTDPKYEGTFLAHTYLNGGISDPLMNANDPTRSTAVFTNTAHATAVFKLNRDDPQYGGVPNCTFYLEGKTIHTLVESNGVISLSGAKVYTNNAALCLLDYLLDPVSGRGLTTSDVSLASFYVAAALADVEVLREQNPVGSIWKGSTERVVRRFETNVALNSSVSVRDNLEKLLEGMDLAELVWSEGVYKLKLAYPLVHEVGASYNLGTVVQYNAESAVDLYRSLTSGNTTLPTSGSWARDVVDAYVTDEDIIRDKEISITYPNAQSRYNLVTCRFRNEAQEFAEDTASWPSKSSDVFMSYMAEDGNVPLETELYEDTVTDYNHALAKAEQRCRQSRIDVVYKLTFTSRLVGLEPGDLVSISSRILKIVAELTRVTDVKIEQNGTVTVELTRFDAAVLAWNANDSVPVTTRNVHVSPLSQASNLSFVVETRHMVSSVGTLYWSSAGDSRVTQYAVVATSTPPEMVTSLTEWTELGVTPNLHWDLQGLLSGAYTLAVVSMTRAGRRAVKVDPITGDKWPAISVGVSSVVADRVTSYRATVYTRSAETPAPPVGGTFDFTRLVFDVAPVGWHVAVPLGALPLFQSDAVLREGESFTWETPRPLGSVTSYAELSRKHVTVIQDVNGVNVGFIDAVFELRAILNNLDVSADPSTMYSVVSTSNCTVVAYTEGPSKGTFLVDSLTGDLGSVAVMVEFGGASFTMSVAVHALKEGFMADLTPPPAPTEAAVVVGLNTVFIDLPGLPNYTEGHGHFHTEVWGSGNLAGVEGNAVFLDSFTGASHAYPSKLATPLQLWLRYRSKDGVLSQFYGGINGIDATTGKIASGDIATKAITTALIGDAAIDSLQVADGAISTAKIGNYIESTTYNQGFSGWHINKNGAAEFNSITIYDGLGNVVMSSGTGTHWEGVTGDSKPADGATRNEFQGPWTVGVEYQRGDTVSRENSSWGSLAQHTASNGNKPPSLPTTFNSYWTLVAGAGVDSASVNYRAELSSALINATSGLPTTIACSAYKKTGLEAYLLEEMWFKVYNDGVLVYTSAYAESSAIAGTAGVHDSIRFEMYDSASFGVPMEVAYAMAISTADGITVLQSNPMHTMSASATNVVDSYEGSGNTIEVYEGSTRLSAAVGPSLAFGQFYIIAVAALGATAGAVTLNAGAAVIADASNLTVGTTVVVATISIRRMDGTYMSVEARQSLAMVPRGEDGAMFVTTIESTNGDVFRKGQAMTTTLNARVFENGVEVTDVIPASKFKWTRVSFIDPPFPNTDYEWNLQHTANYKSITVTVSDVVDRATFHCEISS